MSKKIILSQEQINTIKELKATMTLKQISEKLNISITKVSQVFHPYLTKQEFIQKYGLEAWNLKQSNKAEYDKKYRQINKEKRTKQTAEYWSKHREHQREYHRDYEHNKNISDVNFKLSRAIRSRINSAIKKQNTTKDTHTLELLGTSLENARNYISSKFRDGMSWENHGTLWQIDHVIPCNYFDLSIPENQRICFNYKNLQPLLIKENLSKSDTIPENIDEILLEIKKSL